MFSFLSYICINIPNTITTNPKTEYILKLSFNIKAVHINDKNGVMYAKFEILAVSPFSSANAQEVKAVADVNIPIQVNPNTSFNFKTIAFLENTMYINDSINEDK